MGLIHVLDTEVSNKIAAGEVVERPLSIVKELVENSIDAGATAITVEIKNGGISYIRVSDDGCGMSAEDAKICFLRHATSKISTSDDLDAIYTLGFRGEALSSIGAVAKVKLYTRRSEDADGICVTCEGGEILSSVDAGTPCGTVIEVTDLFYNTPARLKFLKRPASESGYINDILSRYVFSNPQISFKFIRDGKEVIFSSGDNNLKNAIYAIYGRDYAKNMLDVDCEIDGIRVEGMIGKGTLSRANRNYQSFFVNRRYIKSPIMTRALEEAFKNQIMISKFPTAVLNVEIDAKQIDINVHPTKLECKFSDEQALYRAVYHAVKDTLYELPNVPEFQSSAKEKQKDESKDEQEQNLSEIVRERFKPTNEFKFKSEQRTEPVSVVKNEIFSKADEDKKKSESEIFKPAMKIEQESLTDDAWHLNLKKESKKESPQKNEKQPRKQVTEELDPFEFLNKANERARSRKKREPIDEMLYVRDSAVAEKEKKNPFKGDFRIIGQLFETYILIEKEDEMFMIDQHAAHERLNYEKLCRELENGNVYSQILIENVEVKLGGEEFAVYSENKDILKKLGFVCSDKNETVYIEAAPGVEVGKIEPLFIELLTQMKNMKMEFIADAKQRLLYTISCKKAIKGNTELTEVEMKSLAQRVFALENINTCPHGRPIVVSFSKKEIEKSFKRIV